MIIVDTNVISEPIRPQPSQHVIGWLNAQDKSQVYTTTITEAEILLGIAAMAAGKRREMTAGHMNRVLADDFGGRILPFDSAAARELHAVARRKNGKFVIEPDSQIAAIAKSHGAILATRNFKDFKNRGIQLINPWTGETA